MSGGAGYGSGSAGPSGAPMGLGKGSHSRKNGTRIPPRPPSLTLAHASVLMQSPRVPCPSGRWKMVGVLVLTGGPAKPAGPGGPGSPRSP